MRVYIFPNISLEIYEEKLEKIGGVCRQLPGWVLVAGDFNAKSTEWESFTTDVRSEMLGDLISRLPNMHILNRGTVPTFASARGQSIVDVTIGFLAAHTEI